MEYILEVKDIRKSYGPVQAVDGVGFSVREGICFGLLGPNGAGKTTLIEIMESILRADSGDVLFRGKTIGGQYKERIGIQFQSTALQEYITVGETLKLFSALYEKKLPLDEIIEVCALSDIIDRDNRKLSGGQRQRMLLGIALVNDPELVFLDEPTTGLDPQARRNFWGLIKRIKKANKTVILTTHYMDEAEILCDEIAIMDKGVVAAQGSPSQLLASNFDGSIIRVPCDSMPTSLPEGAFLKDDHIEIETIDVEQDIRGFLTHGISLDGLSVHSANLDDLFLKLTGASLRE